MTIRVVREAAADLLGKIGDVRAVEPFHGAFVRIKTPA